MLNDFFLKHKFITTRPSFFAAKLDTIVQMPSKSLVILIMSVGSVLGGYLPTLIGVSPFSFWSLIGSFIGGVLGIYFAFKFFS